MKVVIVGAGVVGLNTALEFQRKYPNADVSVVADKFNQDTTSDGAAGLILPSPSFMGPSYELTHLDNVLNSPGREWMKESFSYYTKLMENANTGITWKTGYIFSNESQEACENLYMKLVSPDYRPATPEELLEKGGGNYKFGLYTSTMIVPCRKLLPWSIQRFEEHGGKIIQKKIDCLKSLAETYDVIYNCTGLGAKYLCNDMELVPIRGQIVQVRASWIKHFYLSEFVYYMIPCGYNDTVTLGGTQDYGSYARLPDQHTSNSIMENCCKFDRNIRQAPVIRTWVGHRPHRSRVRVEIETCKDSVIIHNYGHGGYGVTTSPGSAQYAVNLFSEYHRSTSGSSLKCKM